MQPSLWPTIIKEAKALVESEPMLASFLQATILNHECFEDALSFHLANVLDCATLPAIAFQEIISHALRADKDISLSAQKDIVATWERDAVCSDFITPFLFFKGFQATQAYRIAHHLWQNNRKSMALFFQNRISIALCVDIHPAAQIGSGIMMDHASGIVIGETAVVEDNVSLLHNVTLGGTGKESGDRHPKIGKGVLLSAGATILGNVKIGEGAKVAASSVVLEDVAPHTTVAGVPAKLVGQNSAATPAFTMNHKLCNEQHHD